VLREDFVGGGNGFLEMKCRITKWNKIVDLVPTTGGKWSVSKCHLCLSFNGGVLIIERWLITEPKRNRIRHTNMENI
jgi:hypothetical protein